MATVWMITALICTALTLMMLVAGVYFLIRRDRYIAYMAKHDRPALPRWQFALGVVAFVVGGYWTAVYCNQKFVDLKPQYANVTVQPQQEPATQETTDDKITRISLIAMADELGQSFESKRRTQISKQEASEVAKKTAVFIKDSSKLIDQGMSAQPDLLVSKAQTAFTILGMWPKAVQMEPYSACELSLRGLARMSALRQAAHTATDSIRKAQLIAAADSLVESYRSSADSCLKAV